MQLITGRFGPIEIKENQIISFPEGLIGFKEYKRFVMLDIDAGRNIVSWLQCVDEPDLGFLILHAPSVFPEYNPQFSYDDLKMFGSVNTSNMVLLSVLTVPPEPVKMTANLQAPLIVEPKRRLGKQVITTSAEYTTKHAVFERLQNYFRRTG
jgi:flagellar assembly factor FliW